MIEKLKSKFEDINFVKKYCLIVFIITMLVILGSLAFTPDSPEKEEDEVESNTISFSEINILTVGDIMCHDGQLLDAYNKEENTYDFSSCLEEIKSQIQSADLVTGNLEGVIGSEESGYSGYPDFFMPKSLISSLSDAGFDILTTNNDQFLNAGVNGVSRTISAIKETDITPIGTFNSKYHNPYIRDVDGVKIGFITTIVDLSELMSDDKLQTISEIDFSEYINIYDRVRVRNDINYCKENGADFIICYIHWGEEFSSTITVEMQNISNYLISSGVDLVIGTNPHIVLPLKQVTVKDANDIEKTRLGYVAYSLGNFISNQRDNNADIGVALNFTIRKLKDGNTRVVNINYIPLYTQVNISDGKNFKVMPVFKNSSAPDWMDEYNKERFNRTYDAISQLLNLSFFDHREGNNG